MRELVAGVFVLIPIQGSGKYNAESCKMNDYVMFYAYVVGFSDGVKHETIFTFNKFHLYVDKHRFVTLFCV